MKFISIVLSSLILCSAHATEDSIKENEVHKDVTHVESFRLDEEQLKLRETTEFGTASFSSQVQQISNRRYRVRQSGGRIEIDALRDGQTQSSETIYGTLKDVAFARNLVALSLTSGKCYTLSYQSQWYSDYQYNCHQVTPKASYDDNEDDWFDEERLPHKRKQNHALLLHANNKVYIYAAKRGGLFYDYQYGNLGAVAAHRDLIAFKLGTKTYIYAVQENGFKSDYQYNIEKILPRSKQWDLNLANHQAQQSRNGYLVLAGSNKYYVYTYDRSSSNFANDYQYDAVERVRQLGNTVYIQSANKCRSYSFQNGSWNTDYAYKSCRDWVNDRSSLQQQNFKKLFR